MSLSAFMSMASLDGFGAGLGCCHLYILPLFSLIPGGSFSSGGERGAFQITGAYWVARSVYASLENKPIVLRSHCLSCRVSLVSCGLGDLFGGDSGEASKSTGKSFQYSNSSGIFLVLRSDPSSVLFAICSRISVRSTLWHFSFAFSVRINSMSYWSPRRFLPLSVMLSSIVFICFC